MKRLLILCLGILTACASTVTEDAQSSAALTEPPVVGLACTYDDDADRCFPDPDPTVEVEYCVAFLGFSNGAPPRSSRLFVHLRLVNTMGEPFEGVGVSDGDAAADSPRIRAVWAGEEPTGAIVDLDVARGKGKDGVYTGTVALMTRSARVTCRPAPIPEELVW